MAEHNQIGRTLTTTTATYTIGGKAGKKYKHRLLKKSGHSVKSAQALLRKELHDETLVVLEVAHETRYYWMTVDDFVAVAQNRPIEATDTNREEE